MSTSITRVRTNLMVDKILEVLKARLKLVYNIATALFLIVLSSELQNAMNPHICHTYCVSDIQG